MGILRNVFQSILSRRRIKLNNREEEKIIMIRHVVMFKYQEEAEGNDKKYNLNKTKELLEKLQDKVEEIKYIFI